MSAGVEQSQAYVIHRRDYGETSRILSCFTQSHGKVDILCKGCKRPGKRSRVLEPFRLYDISWSGRSELKTMRQADELQSFQLIDDARQLYCGFYLNELLYSIIRHNETEPALFAIYTDVLARLSLSEHKQIPVLLRRFELNLLQVMGYGITLDIEPDGETPIDLTENYGFKPEQGFFRTSLRHQVLVRGDTLLALSKGEFTQPHHDAEAKKLTRFLISYYLPDSSIQSRKLFL